jgi:hypothetical protein
VKKLLLLLALSACDAIDKKLSESYDVTCYSADTIIYHGYAEGRIAQDGPVWYFKEAKTGKFIRVSGNCLIIRE